MPNIDAEKEKIRAAFAYMGPQTQAGLTLEALAKGAGILIDALRSENVKLRAEVEHQTFMAKDAATARDKHWSDLKAANLSFGGRRYGFS